MTKTNTAAMAVGLLLMAAWLTVPTGLAEAQHRGEHCLGGTLAQEQDGDDLLVKVDCTVRTAGTYKFRNVNIIKGGVLRFTDATIDFWAANILVENGGSLIAGSPPGSGSGPIGTNGGGVTIHLYGQDQTGQNPQKPGKGITCLGPAADESGLSDPERCGVPKDIWDSNVDGAHNPVPPAQARKISDLPSASSYVGVKDDYFYPYHPLPFDDADMKGYFGYKVLAVSYGGTLQLFGKKGATYSATGECGETAPSTSGTSWARLNGTPTKNPTTLTVDRKVSLRKGDQIVVTTTDYLPGHSEQLTVSADVACGTTITVDETLQYEHSGTRYSLSAVRDKVLDPDLKSAGAETRAAVALLTRSIRIFSAGDTKDQDFPAEATGYFFGGHLVARQGFQTFQVQGVEFYQMGQGGRLGHYPVHFHHARKTPPGTFVKDSSIHDSMTRWIVLHGTQDVTLERNPSSRSSATPAPRP